MRKLFLVLLASAVALSAALADDLADAREAFDTMVDYQKMDDPRSLELFSQDVATTVTFDTGKETKDHSFTPERFRQILILSLAKKEGSKDLFEDIKATQECGALRVSCMRTDEKTHKKGAFMVAYTRDASGQLKITTVHMTVPVDKIPKAE